MRRGRRGGYASPRSGTADAFAPRLKIVQRAALSSGNYSDFCIIGDMSAADAISLTRSLLAYDTINPPGREQDCARHAGALLGEWGFSVAYHDYEPGRTSVVARAGGNDAPLCLTGHLDTVALG